jgi:hypothetical protein
MLNPGVPQALWSVLDGGLWHATDMRGLSGILADDCIRVSVADRYLNSLCRCMQAVSLFDFGPGSRDQNDPEFSNWYGWFGNQHLGRVVFWLQIDRNMVTRNLMESPAVLEASRSRPGGPRFFVGVEACHSGPVARSALTGALLIDQHDLNRFHWHKQMDASLISSAEVFESSLPAPPQENALVRALRQRRAHLGSERAK